MNELRPFTRYRYLIELFRRSWKGPLGITELIELVLAVAGGAFATWKPQMAGEYSYLLWFIPLVVFLTTFVVSWCTAGHSLHVEDHANFAKETEQLKQQAANISSFDGSVHDLIEQLDSIGSRCVEIGTQQDATEVQAEVVPLLREYFGKQEAKEFEQVICKIANHQFWSTPSADKNTKLNQCRQQLSNQIRSLKSALKSDPAFVLHRKKVSHAKSQLKSLLHTIPEPRTDGPMTPISEVLKLTGPSSMFGVVKRDWGEESKQTIEAVLNAELAEKYNKILRRKKGEIALAARSFIESHAENLTISDLRNPEI